MTALKDSGMHIVFSFKPEHLHRIVHHLFFLENYFRIPPQGYDCYYLTPARMPGDVDHVPADPDRVGVAEGRDRG